MLSDPGNPLMILVLTRQGDLKQLIVAVKGPVHLEVLNIVSDVVPQAIWIRSGVIGAVHPLMWQI